MENLSDSQYRRRLIARVEALRMNAGMTRHAFHQQIGPVASECWINFTTLSEEEAWHHFCLKGVSRIGKLFGVGADLLQFKS